MALRGLILLLFAGFVACATGGRVDSDDAAVDAGGDPGAREIGRDVDEEAAPADTAEAEGSAADVDVDVEPPPRFTALRIEPDTLSIEATLGVEATASVRVVGVTPTGDSVVVTPEAFWRTSAHPVLSVDDEGTVRTPGTLGGEATLRAEVGALSAELDVRVRITQVRILDGITPEEVAAFERGDGGVSAPLWTYPLDGTVYPSGIEAIRFQWTGEGMSLYRLTLQLGEWGLLHWYTRTAAVMPSLAEWTAISAHPGLDVVGYVAGAATAGADLTTSAPLTFRTADADLLGSVYYWQIRTGDIMEIPADESTARPLFPDNATNGNCRGCHAITRDGGRIGFMYNGGDNPRAGLAWVGAPDPPVVSNGSSFQWDWLSFEPAGLRAAAVYGGDMWLVDTTPGLAGGIASLGPIEPANRGGRKVTHPSWSPDGTHVAFIERDAASVDWSFTTGNLWLMPWHAADGSFGDPRLLVAGGGDIGDTVSYPTWSPDGRWIAYSRGPSNRGDPPASIWIADPLTGDATQLARGVPANDGVMPAFSPFREGGYYWLLFYSSRPYGSVTSNKQLWVMAVDVGHIPGTDPSHAAFWLPGQNPAETNITGYWARAGCDNAGETCKSDADCCVGLACRRDDARGEDVCQAVECILPGRPCVAADVCCPGFECATSLLGTDVCTETFTERPR